MIKGINYFKKRLFERSPYKKRGDFGFFMKSDLKTLFFPVVTIILCFSILAVNVLVAKKEVEDSLENNYDIWKYNLEKVGFLNDHQQKLLVKQIRNSFEEEILDYANSFGLKSTLESDLDGFERVYLEWLKEISFLNDYSLTSKGLVVKDDPERSFTEDFVLFLENIKPLEKETKDLYERLEKYKKISLLTNSTELQSVVDKIDYQWSFLSSILKNSDNILDLLGHFEEKSFVIFNQDLNEPRPTGGLLDSYIKVTVSRGRFDIEQQRYLNKGSYPAQYYHPALSYYNFWGDRGVITSALQNTNYFSCFEDSAEIIVDLLDKDSSSAVDGVFFVSSKTFEILSRGEISFSSRDDFSSSFGSLLNLVGKSYKNDFIDGLFLTILTRDLQYYFVDSSNRKKFKFDSLTVCQNDNPDFVISPLIIDLGDYGKTEKSNLFKFESRKVLGGIRFDLDYEKVYSEVDNDFENGLVFVGLQVPQEAYNLELSSSQIMGLDPEESFEEGEAAFDRKGGHLKGLKRISRNGFVYQQPDGSSVFGGYVDNLDSHIKIKFSFTLPIDKYQTVKFYGQPGLKNSSVSLSPGLSFYDPNFDSILEVQSLIQSGVRISIDKF